MFAHHDCITGSHASSRRTFSSVQILVHCKIRSVAHADNLNLVYPVAGLGAEKQLKHLELGLRHMVTERISQQFRLKAHGSNANEGCLCETSESRLGEILDYFIRGQSLYYLSAEGKAMVKEYAKTEWVEVS